MSKQKHILSKSRFISGAQCHKKLYFDLFRKDLKPPTSPEQQRMFDTGHKVGEIAQQVFPGGRDASPEHYWDFSKSIESTSNWIREGVSTIYEPAFQAEGILAALDILHSKNGERWAIEVKSSTSVKEYHYTDAALQYWVMDKAGFPPDKFFLMHINKEYIKNGEIEPNKLFVQEDITSEVIEKQSWVEEKIVEFKKMIANGLEPEIAIGPHCSDPFDCDYAAYCWKHIPENSVFELGNARGKDWDLYEKGIVMLKDIPEETDLNHRQKIQVNGVKDDKPYIDKAAIKGFIDDVVYPLYFFDFETVGPAIPLLNGTRPFQAIPFQYSLHILESVNSKAIHKEFLADPEWFHDSSVVDPLKKLMDQMKLDIGTEGSLIAYYIPFEKGVLKNLTLKYPDEEEYIDQLRNRFVDLMHVFSKGWYYLPSMKASASIKDVLPAIVPEMTYKGMEVSQGGEASAFFLDMINGEFKGDPGLKRKALLEYCERDTEGMVVIWEKFWRVYNLLLLVK